MILNAEPGTEQHPMFSSSRGQDTSAHFWTVQEMGRGYNSSAQKNERTHEEGDVRLYGEDDDDYIQSTYIV